MEQFDQRIQTEQVLHHEVVTVSWNHRDLEEDLEFKLSGLLLTPDTALVIADGNVEIHIVEKQENGEFLPTKCFDPMFHIGDRPELYPSALHDLTTLSVIEFVRKYPHFEYLESTKVIL
jgi:hypothetical protein